MNTIFELLGMVLDDLSEGIRFKMEFADGTTIIECDNSVIIDRLILPLMDEGEIGNLLERSKWYYSIIKIKQDRITEVVLGNDLGDHITSKIEKKILSYLADYGVDDTYTILCHEIAKKCGFIIDKVNIM